MAEPLAVDPTGLSAAAAKLAGLVFRSLRRRSRSAERIRW